LALHLTPLRVITDSSDTTGGEGSGQRGTALR